MEAFGSRGRYIFHGLTRNTHTRRPVVSDVATRKGDKVVYQKVGDKLVPKKNIANFHRRMPSKYRSRRSARRRKLYKKKRRTAQPYSMARTFKTCTYTTLNPGNGTLASAILQLNSAYDPTGLISTSQGLGFDQFETLYRRYAVVKWGVKIEYASTDNTNPLVVGFTPTTKDSALTAYAHYKECPGTISGIITPDIDKFQLYTKGRVKPYLLPKGGKLMNDEDCTALTSANPTKLLYGHLWAQEIGASADPALVHLVITIYQTLVFFDPIVPARSSTST